MIYIRTKDGIYRVAKNIMLATLPMRYAVLDKKEDIRIGSVSEKDVVQQADTIEELCDRLVYDSELYFTRKPNEDKTQITPYDDFGIEEPITKEMLKKGIYGAIWTDKGLTYIAKMNKKGELELL